MSFAGMIFEAKINNRKEDLFYRKECGIVMLHSFFIFFNWCIDQRFPHLFNKKLILVVCI